MQCSCMVRKKMFFVHMNGVYTVYLFKSVIVNDVLGGVIFLKNLWEAISEYKFDKGTFRINGKLLPPHRVKQLSARVTFEASLQFSPKKKS